MNLATRGSCAGPEGWGAPYPAGSEDVVVGGRPVPGADGLGQMEMFEDVGEGRQRFLLQPLDRHALVQQRCCGYHGEAMSAVSQSTQPKAGEGAQAGGKCPSSSGMDSSTSDTLVSKL